MRAKTIFKENSKMNYLRRVGVVILVLVGLGGMAWLERVPLLRGAANLWIVSDEATHADAVVVLGGGLEERPFIAADVYHKGLARIGADFAGCRRSRCRAWALFKDIPKRITKHF
jgi:hypothetical protein